MIYEYKGIRPKLAKNVFLAPGVILLGDVEIGEGSNLWFYTVARGDVNHIRIGRDTNIQDHCMLHVTGGKFPLVVGDGVIAGHRAVLHGCTIHDGVLIGIGALVLDGAVVEEGAMVAAGAVVAPGSVIPADTVALGVPAKPTRAPTAEERAFHKKNCMNYRNYGLNFRDLVEPV
ncbi:gamma carbonic anhydrase family protein [Thermodesulfobacteriota bacterium]